MSLRKWRNFPKKKRIKQEEREEKRSNWADWTVTNTPLSTPHPRPPQTALTLMTNSFLQTYIVFPDLGQIKEFIQLALLAQSLKKNSTNVLSFSARQALLLLTTYFSSSKLIYLVRFWCSNKLLVLLPFQKTELRDFFFFNLGGKR